MRHGRMVAATSEIRGSARLICREHICHAGNQRDGGVQCGGLPETAGFRHLLAGNQVIAALLPKGNVFPESMAEGAYRDVLIGGETVAECVGVLRHALGRRTHVPKRVLSVRDVIGLVFG